MGGGNIAWNRGTVASRPRPAVAAQAGAPCRPLRSWPGAAPAPWAFRPTERPSRLCGDRLPELAQEGGHPPLHGADGDVEGVGDLPAAHAAVIGQAEELAIA